MHCFGMPSRAGNSREMETFWLRPARVQRCCGWSGEPLDIEGLDLMKVTEVAGMTVLGSTGDTSSCALGHGSLRGLEEHRFSDW
jgi:hypothetical protein